MHNTAGAVGRLKLPFAGYSVGPPSLLRSFGATSSLKLSGMIRRSRAGIERAKAEPQADKFAGGHRIRVTPVPIPNTEVKPDTADGTVWETVWESRSLPAVFTKKARCHS